jgi:hypothetical protein
VVKAKKGLVEQEFVLLIIAALPSEAGLPNESISCWIKVFDLSQTLLVCIINLCEKNTLAYFVAAFDAIMCFNTLE